MKNNNLLIAIFLLISLSAAIAEQIPTSKYEKQMQVIVEGMVYCQSCNKFGTWSLTGAQPIPSAKVSVICKDHFNRMYYYNVFETDSHGYFQAQLDQFKMRDNIMDHPLQSCHVRLVSSPLQDCNLLSNINHGLDGSSLRYENKRLAGTNYEAVIYAAGPLAFRPNDCVY